MLWRVRYKLLDAARLLKNMSMNESSLGSAIHSYLNLGKPFAPSVEIEQTLTQATFCEVI